jgi:hypothetical protein
MVTAGAAAALLLGGAGGWFATRETSSSAAPPAHAARVESPYAPYVQRLNAAFTQLDRTRERMSAELDGASTPSAQATALTRLATQYADARDAVASANPPADTTALNDRVKDALDGLAATYRRLGTAARHGDRGAYARNRGRVSRGQSALTAALQGLEQAGFRLR